MTASAVIFLDTNRMVAGKVLGLLVVFIYVAGFAAPNHYFPWASYHNELPSAVALALGTGWCLIHDWKRNAPTSGTVFALFALSGIPLIQACFGLIPFWGDAITVFLYLVGAALACYCAYLLAKSKACGSQKLLEWISWSLLIAGLLSLTIVLTQVLDLDYSPWVMYVQSSARPIANLGQPNQVTTLFLVSFLSLIHLHAIQKIRKYAFYSIAILLGIGLAAVQSRSGLLVYGVLAGWLVWKLPRNLANRKALIKSSLTLLGMFVGLWFLWPHFLNLINPDAGLSARVFQDPARLTIWRQMIDAISSAPAFGYGWGQVGLAQIAVAEKWTTGGMLQSAHNLFLDIIVWNGLALGLLIVASIVIWGMKGIVKEQSISSWSALGVIGAVMTHSMLEYPLHYTYFLFLTAAMVGVVNAELHHDAIRINKTLIVGVALAALVAFARLIFEYPSVEESIQKLRFRSAGAAVSADRVHKDVEDVRLLSQMKSFVDFSLTQVRDGISPNELDKMKTIAHRFPYSSSLYMYALALAANGEPDMAAREMNILRNIHGQSAYQDARKKLSSMQTKYPKIAEVLNAPGRSLAPDQSAH